MRKWAIAAAVLFGCLLLVPQASATLGPATGFGTGSNPLDVAIADMDQDGHRDLVSSNLTSQSVSVLLGNGAGSFAAKKDFSVPGGARSVAVGNLNGDALPDVVVIWREGTVAIMPGLGGGDLGAPVTYPSGPGSLMIAMADVDKDGNSDLAVANSDPGSYGVSILLGNGDGTFAPRTSFAIDEPATSLAFGDFNAGGNVDLAVTEFDGS